jgi:hypothetical protein
MRWTRYGSAMLPRLRHGEHKLPIPAIYPRPKPLRAVRRAGPASAALEYVNYNYNFRLPEQYCGVLGYHLRQHAQAWWANLSADVPSRRSRFTNTPPGR